MYETILKKINPKSDIGKILNHLQDVAEQVLSEKEFHKYLELAMEKETDRANFFFKDIKDKSFEDIN